MLKHRFIVVAGVLLGSGLVGAAALGGSSVSIGARPIVVELFTSQGCSS